jgi:dienelactone hydrolase
MRLLMLALVAASVLSGAAPLPVEPEIVTRDQRLEVSIGGRDLSLAARIYRPAAEGVFPLVVIHHGTPVSMLDAGSMRLSYDRAARWFAGRNFLVVVALRPGFGSSDGPYLEPSGPSHDRNYVRDGLETAAVEFAIVSAAARLPGVDSRRIIVVGQSSGGFGAIALADQPPVGVAGVISFAGGRGGDGHEHISGGAERLIAAAGELGRRNRVPQLWLYAANDHFFPPRVAHEMFQAYKAGSSPPMRFVDLPSFDGDGHKTLAQADPSVWAEAVAAFLADPLQGGH